MPLLRSDYRKKREKKKASVLGSELAHFVSSHGMWRAVQGAKNQGRCPAYIQPTTEGLDLRAHKELSLVDNLEREIFQADPLQNKPSNQNRALANTLITALLKTLTRGT